MEFKLEHIIPNPLRDTLDDSSQIWGKELTLSSTKKYKINAPSGKGKSTLMHILYSLRKDFQGTISLDGKSLSNLSHHELAAIRKNQLSVIFQDLRLFPKLSAYENIVLNAFGENVETRIEDYATRLGVKSLLQNPCGVLSYGEQQRIAIIRALIQPFDFLLMDEPFSHLDEQNINIACQLIEEVCAENKAGFVLATLGYDYQLNYDEELNL